MMEALPFYHKIFVFLIDFIAIILFVAVFFRNPKIKVNQIFSGMVAMMLGWVNFAYFARLFYPSDFSSLFLSIAWFVTPLFFVLLYFMVVNLFLNENERVPAIDYSILFLGGISSYFTGFTDFIIADTKLVNGNYTIIYGDWMIPFLLVITYFVACTLYFLIKKYFGSAHEEKGKVQYILVGALIFYVANTIFNITFPIFFGIVHLYYFGDYSSIFLLFFTAIAIIRKRLFDIRIVLAQIFIVLIALILFVQVLAESTLQGYLVQGSIFVAFVLMGIMLNRSLISELKAKDQIKEQVVKLNEKTKDLQALFRISKTSISSLNTDDLVGNVISSILKELKHLGFKGAIFMTASEQKGKYVLSHAIFNGVDGAKSMSKFLSNNVEALKSKRINQSITKQKIIFGTDFYRSLCPPLSKDICNQVKDEFNLRGYALVPVNISDKSDGLLMLFSRKPAKDMEAREEQILVNVANNFSLALENRKLYLEVSQALKDLAVKTKALESANTQLKKFDQAKSEFISIASHQLRTPLTVIKGYLSMMEESFFGEMPDKIRDTVDKLLRSTDRLINLVNDLLDISRIETGHMHFNLKKMSIKQMVADLADGMKRIAAQKGLKLNQQIDKKVPDIVGDDAKLREVLSNLIDNAIKYTDKGEIDVILKQDDGHVEFIVQDTGQGIMKKDLPRLFQKFARGEGMHVVHTEGTGLGLFVCKKIVEAHSGKIWAESEGKNKGSKFTVKLPVDLKEGEITSKKEAI